MAIEGLEPLKGLDENTEDTFQEGEAEQLMLSSGFGSNPLSDEDGESDGFVP